MFERNLLLTRQNIQPQENEWQLIQESETGSSEIRFGYLSYPSPQQKTETRFFNGNVVKRSSKPEYFLEYFEQKKNKKKGNLISPDKKNYLETVKKLQAHIQRGDIYEINYCISYELHDVQIDPYKTFLKLNAISEAPQACLAKFGNNWIVCSSPERFIKRNGNKLITQPIKGTTRRSSDAIEDEQLRNELKNSLKEKTENVMIVDVARNDLSRIAEKGSVRVDELFGVYSFRQVHQMISTISCSLRDNVNLEEITQATFPMASMTGAPKIRAMQLINEYEKFNREFYSGSIGIMNQHGDVDLNVVIRSIIYNEKEQRASVGVGSAITALSDPEKEWEECGIKAKAMLNVLH